VSATAPEAGWSREPEHANAHALRLMRWIALTLGRRVARGAVHLTTLYFLVFVPGPRRHARRYLTRALGRPASWLDVYRLTFSFGATVLDRVYLLGGQMHLFDITVHQGELVESAMDQGRGAFLLGAHVGSFEALRAVGDGRIGHRVAMIMYPDNARLINEALAELAPGFEPPIIALGRPESMLAVRDWLDDGGLAGMLGDRSLPTESHRAGSLRLNFLGREAVFSDAPFRLAALLRRRVYFMAGLYLGGNRYDVRFDTIADFSTRCTDAAERERRIEDALRSYAGRLEALCREQPYNWFNFHDFWREDTA
jgi:predicted LPLAT superfamily acyltransferase